LRAGALDFVLIYENRRWLQMFLLIAADIFVTKAAAGKPLCSKNDSRLSIINTSC
jgi:hypothetical protein